MFSFGLLSGEPRYIRRARAYLQEARMSMLEHSIAAEHYQASADMYAERAKRLEEEIAAWSASQSGALPEVYSPAETVNSGPSTLGVTPAEGGKPQRTKVPPSVGIVRAA
jgi:fructoselysine-6-P-deglycase FrlB-like protein